MKLKSFCSYSGKDILTLLSYSAVVGFFWFAVEASFVYIIQGFLHALGLTPLSVTFLPSWYPTAIGYSLLIFFSFSLARVLLQSIRTYLVIKTAQTFVFDRRKAIMHMGLDLAGRVTFKELNSHFTEMVVNASTTYTYLAQLCNSLIAGLCMTIFGFIIAPKEMAIGILILACSYPILKMIFSKIEIYGRNVAASWKQINETLVEGLKNNFLLKIYGMIDFEKESGTRALDHIRVTYDKYALLFSISGGLPFLLGSFAICAVAFVSITYLGTKGAVLMSFIYVFIRISQIGSEASGHYSSLALSVPFLKQLFSWEQDQQKIVSDLFVARSQDSQVGGDIQSIEMKNLGLAYVGDQFLFRDLNLSLKIGDMLVVKGRSGGGKSSLINLLIGYVRPTEGAIIINNEFDLAKTTVNYFNQIAYAGPEPYLVAGTVRFNILYGNKRVINDDEIWVALKTAGLNKDIAGLAQGLDTYMGDVATLSTGQKQRLALARAFLRKPRLLILDEATANLDKDTEEAVIAMMKTFLSEMIVVVVSHKDSFDGIASKTLLMGNNEDE